VLQLLRRRLRLRLLRRLRRTAARLLVHLRLLLLRLEGLLRPQLRRQLVLLLRLRLGRRLALLRLRRLVLQRRIRHRNALRRHDGRPGAAGRGAARQQGVCAKSLRGGMRPRLVVGPHEAGRMGICISRSRGACAWSSLTWPAMLAQPMSPLNAPGGGMAYSSPPMPAATSHVSRTSLHGTNSNEFANRNQSLAQQCVNVVIRDADPFPLPPPPAEQLVMHTAWPSNCWGVWTCRSSLG